MKRLALIVAVLMGGLVCTTDADAQGRRGNGQRQRVDRPQRPQRPQRAQRRDFDRRDFARLDRRDFDRRDFARLDRRDFFRHDHRADLRARDLFRVLQLRDRRHYHRDDLAFVLARLVRDEHRLTLGELLLLREIRSQRVRLGFSLNECY